MVGGVSLAKRTEMLGVVRGRCRKSSKTKKSRVGHPGSELSNPATGANIPPPLTPTQAGCSGIGTATIARRHSILS